MTAEQLLQAAAHCTEAAKERAGDALQFAQVEPTDPTRAAEQAALAALQATYAIERLIEALGDR